MLRNLCGEKSGRGKRKILSSCAYRLIDEYENPLLGVFEGPHPVITFTE